jgi:hypothetical protein
MTGRGLARTSAAKLRSVTSLVVLIERLPF